MDWTHALGNSRPFGPGGEQIPPPDDKTHLQKVKDEVRAIFQRPNSGRTTRLGRKVEKPGNATAAGPSGQHEGTKHDLKHTNK